MTVFTLTLIRHGETNYNKQRIIQGQLDTELSEKGYRQAKLVANRLQYEKFTHAFTSDLKRAKKTLEVILEQNKWTNCSISTDERLRERKFGVYQGRSSDEFRRDAKKKGRPLHDYTPPDAETISQLRLRAVDFFEDLCAQLTVLSKEEGIDTPASIKRRRQTGSFCSASSEVFPVSESPTDSDAKLETLDPTDSQKELSHSSSGSTSSTSGYSSTGADSLEHLGPLSPADPSPSGTIPSFGSSASSSYDDMAMHIFTPVFDSEIRSTIRGPQTLQHGCPNVSLSPIFEHRLSSISSISSGRNSSFDEGDMLPSMAGDVLIVSHGGLIQQLILYFVDQLGCKIPGGKNAIMRTPHNTAISKFTISMNEGEELPRLTCLLIYDRDHLLNDPEEDAIEKNISL